MTAATARLPDRPRRLTVGRASAPAQSIATEVAVVKIGATDYLAKPADANDVTAALLATPEEKPEAPENPMSADRVLWEHVHRIHELCDRNVSETARRLHTHRRTLQPHLAERAQNKGAIPA